MLFNAPGHISYRPNDMMRIWKGMDWFFILSMILWILFLSLLMQIVKWRFAFSGLYFSFPILLYISSSKASIFLDFLILKYRKWLFCLAFDNPMSSMVTSMGANSNPSKRFITSFNGSLDDETVICKGRVSATFLISSDTLPYGMWFILSEGS